jgi:hypothetical protein
MSNSTGFAVIIVIMGLIATYFLPTIIALTFAQEKHVSNLLT